MTGMMKMKAQGEWMLNMAQKEKFILLEENKPEEILPAVKLEQEPVPLSPELTPELSVPKEEIPQEVVATAFSTMVGSLISREWESIDALNSAIATFTIENPEDVSAIEILKQIVDEKTTHVGMLHKVLGKDVEGLVKAGEEKADSIIEPKEEKELKESLSVDFDLEDLDDIRNMPKFLGDFYYQLYIGAFERLLDDEDPVGYSDDVFEVMQHLDKEKLIKVIKSLGDNFTMPDAAWESIDNEVNENIEEYLLRNKDSIMDKPLVVGEAKEIKK